MKKFKTLLLSLGAISLASCSSEAVDQPENPVEEAQTGMEVMAAIDDATRASGTTWDNNDAIGITCTGYSGTAPAGAPAWGASHVMNKYKNYQYKYASTGAKFGAVNTIWFERGETYMFSAYYPYQTGTLGQDITYSIDTSTTQGSPEQKNIDILYAPAVSASKTAPTANFTFDHKMAKLKLVFNFDTNFGFSTDESANCNGLRPILGGINHKGKFTSSNGTLALDGTATIASWDVVNTGRANRTVGADKRSVIFEILLVPQTVSSLAVSMVDANGVTYSLPSALTGVKLEAGKTALLTVTVKKTALEVTNYEIAAWTTTTSAGVNAEIQ